jgi:hypothetical protein
MDDFNEVKARVRSYPQRLWCPVPDPVRRGTFLIGYWKDGKRYALLKEADVEYVASAVMDLPLVLDEVERLRSEIQKLKKTLPSEYWEP